MKTLRRQFSVKSLSLPRSLYALAIITALGLTVSIIRADDAPPIRIFNCDQKVQSHKRGICENHLSADDFRAIAPGVSWYYNWHFKTDDIPPSDAPMEYLPMAWGNRPESVNGLDDYLRSVSKKPRVVLAINEPNLKGQAFITPQITAELYTKIKAVADKYQLPVVGPNMSLGSATNDSIKTMDPIENKEVTYTFMVPFLKAFFFYLQDKQVAALSVHTYGSIGELKWAVDSMHKEFNCPIWVTEYAEWKAGSPKDERDFLIQATDFLERTPYVQGYAWFKERVNDNQKISLLAKESGKLTELGQTYVDLPTHDADVYYRLPGKLPAGNYVTIDKADVMANSRNSLLINTKEAGATADYNLQVDNAGDYKLALTVFGTGKVEILEKDQVFGSIDSTGSEVQTVATTVTLPGGAQTLRLRFSANGMIVSALEFTKP